eukprot:scaffold103110_cov57-Phaeocystis_antarctica.AAC.2
MVARLSMTTAAVKAHSTVGGNPIVTPVCGITVEQSPSGKPNAKANGNVLGVSAQFIGGCESELEARSTGSHCGGHATGCSSTWSAANPSELAPTTRVSARWSRNSAASLRSTMAAVQSASAAPCST